MVAGRLTYGAVRWQSLFDDLEAQLDHEERAELDAEVAERVRAERATVALADRLLAHAVGSDSRSPSRGAGPRACARRGAAVAGARATARGRTPVLVPTEAVVAVRGLARAVAPAPGWSSTGSGWVTRCAALAATGRGRACTPAREVLNGTIDRVGADHLDLAEHPGGEARRGGAVLRWRRGVGALLAVRG